MEQVNHKDKLRTILKEASAKGASKSQMEKIVTTYKTKYMSDGETNIPSKKVQTEESGVSGSASVQSPSSVASTQKKSPEPILGKSHGDFINKINEGFKPKDNTKTFVDSSGKRLEYNKDLEDVKVEPITGKATVYKKEDLGVGKTINKSVNVKDNKELYTLPRKTQEALRDKSSMVSEYIADKGLEGKVADPKEIAKGYFLLGEEVPQEEIIKQSGIDLKDFEKYYQNKVEETSKNIPKYEFEDIDTPTHFNTGSLNSFASLRGDATEFVDDNTLYENIGDISKYGFNTTDFSNYLKVANPRLNEVIAQGNKEGIEEKAFENLIYKSLRGYTEKRAKYLSDIVQNKNLRRERGEDVNADEETKELNSLSKNLESFVKENLPNYSLALEQKNKETAEEYAKYKNGERRTIGAVGKFMGNAYEGVASSLGDLSLFVLDKVEANSFAEQFRINRDMNKMLEADDLMYIYEKGRVVEQKGTRYIVTNEGRIIDADVKKDITNIAKDLGLNPQQMMIDASQSKEEDYSFSAGNSSYMMGEVLGALAVQIIGTKGIGTALGSTTKAQMLSGMAMGSAVSYTSSYEGAYQSLREHGLRKSEATRLANEVASTVALTTALTSTIAYNPKALQAFNLKPKMNQMIQNVMKAEATTGKRGVAKIVKDYTLDVLHGSAKEGVQEAMQENLEYFSEQMAGEAVNRTLGEKVLSEDISLKEVISNSVLAFASSSAMASVGEVRSKSGITDKIQLYGVLANDFDGFQKTLTQMQDEGHITSAKAEQMSREVDNFRKYANKLPTKVSEENLFPILELVAKRNEAVQEKNNTDSAFHASIKEEIKAIDEEISKAMEVKVEFDESGDITLEQENRLKKLEEDFKTKDESIAQEIKTKEESLETLKESKEKVSEEFKQEKDAIKKEKSRVENNKLETKIQEETKALKTLEDSKEQLLEDRNKNKESILKEYEETRTEPKRTVEATETESTERKTKSEEEVKQTYTEDEISKVDLSEDIGLNKVNAFLDDLDAKLKQYSKENLGMNLPVVVAQTALTAMRASTKTAKTGLDVLSAGINAVRNSDWYKNLNDSEKAKLTDEEIKNSLLGKRLKPSADPNKKVVISEVKQLREKLENLARGYRQGIRDTTQIRKDFVKQAKETIKGLGKYLTESEVKTLMNQVAKVSPSNINEVSAVVERIVDRLEVRREKQINSTIPSLQRKAKKKAKTVYGNFGENVRSLASIDPADITQTHYNEYLEVIESLAKNKDVDFDRVNQLYDNMQQDIEDSIQRKYEEKLSKTKETKDNSESVVAYKDLVDKLVFHDELTDFEKGILRDLKQVPLDYIRTLPKSKIDALNRALLRNNVNGFLENKTVNDVVMKHKAVKTADNVRTKVGDILLKPFGGINSWIDRLKGKDFTADDFEKRMFNVMLQHIDSTIKGIKGTIFYDNIIHPITSGLDKAGSSTKKVENKFSSMFTKVVKSSKKNEFSFNVELQLYFRQKEFESNPELIGKQVFSLEEHMEAMERSRGALEMSDSTYKVVMDIYNKFPKTSQEMYDKFNSEEKALVKYMEDTLLDLSTKSRDVNNHLRGETLIYTKDYFPRSNSFVKSDATEEISIQTRMQNMLGSTATQAGASNLRNASKANPLRFDTSGIFMNHVKEANIEAELSRAVKQTGITLTELKKSDNESLVTVAVGLENGVKSLLESQLKKNPYTSNSKRDVMFKTLVRNSFSRMLIDPIRLTYDMLTNYVPVYGSNIDRIGKIMSANKSLDDSFVKVFNEDISSVQAERMGGSRSVDFKDSLTTTLGKSKYKQANVSILDKMIDLYTKNKLTDFSEKANLVYYNIADKPAQHMWKFYLVDEFKKLTGKELDATKYKNDSNYRNDIKEDLQKATARADKLTTNLFNTASVAEQKINVQQTRNDFYTRMNSFMRSFTFNENRVFWDSFHGIFGTGTTTFDSKAEAVRAFGIVNVRSIAYSYMAQMMLVMLGNALGFKDDDDESSKIALRRALGQHGMLVALGNKGVVVEMIGGVVVEQFNKMMIESEYDSKKKKYEKYNQYEDGIMFASPEKGSMADYYGNLGAEGYAMMALYDTGTLAYNILDKSLVKGEEITEEDWIKFKTFRITSSFIAQMTGLPVERMGKLVQRTLDAEVKEEEERKKRRKKLLKMYN